MKEKILTIFFAIILVTSFAPAAVSAEDPDSDLQAQINEILDDQMNASGAGELFEALPGETEEYMKELGISDVSLSSLLSLDVGQVFKLFTEMAADYINKTKGMFLSIIGVILIAVFVETLKENFSESSFGKLWNIISVLCLVGIVIVPVYQSMGRVLSALKNSSNFITAMIPVLAGILVAGGHAVSGLGYNITVYTLAQIISALASSLLGPLVGIYLAFSVSSSVSSEFDLGGAAKGIKSAASWIMGLSATIFAAVLTAQTTISSSADSVIIKAGKFVMGSAIPVIGGALSDAVSTIRGCLGLLKNVVGIFGIISVIFIFGPALIECLIWLTVLNVSAFVADIFSVKEIGKLLRSVSGAVSLMCAMLVFSGILLIVSLSIVLLVTGNGG